MSLNDIVEKVRCPSSLERESRSTSYLPPFNFCQDKDNYNKFCFKAKREEEFKQCIFYKKVL